MKDIWTPVANAVPGDPVKIVLMPPYGKDDERESLVDGKIVRATRATRTFTIEGAKRDGEVSNRANQRWPSENQGFADIDGRRCSFRIATETDIARLTDPNRDLKEALDDALRDLRWSARRQVNDVEAADTLISELTAALESAKALKSALA
jgi:hypothetical protein